MDECIEEGHISLVCEDQSMEYGGMHALGCPHTFFYNLLTCPWGYASTLQEQTYVGMYVLPNFKIDCDKDYC